MHLHFEKDNMEWYIILPEWKGSKADLAMVSGADTLLDQLSNYTNSVSIEVSLEPIYDSSIHLSKVRNCWFNGADYITCSGHKLWLCNVTKFVFGDLPNNIYIRCA